MTRRRRRLSALGVRLLAAQLLVIGVAALALAVTAQLVAPAVFRTHLARAGVTAEPVRHHAEVAFASALSISVTAAAFVALVAAVLVSVFIVRRVSEPVAQLAAAADAVAAGDYRASVPRAPFSSELDQLSLAFARMATRLADTDAARTRLLADLSHELRNPLATLTAYVDGLDDGVIEADAEAWRTMRTQLQRLRRLAVDVRAVATADDDLLDLHRGPVDVAEMARSVVTAARPQYASRSVGLHADVPEHALVIGDSARLAQVLQNLLDNALRYTPAAGEVTVRVATADAAVTVTVTDTGTGIPEDQMEAVFERFHRVDASRAAADGSGSGLGLAIARAIVTAHHGTIVASPNPDRGTVFTITLPSAG